MGKSLVSILMTSFNSEKFIREAIDSVLAQTYENWELLIADDCSTDRTRDIIATYSDSRISTYHNAKNIHYLRTRNKLVGLIKGDFIALLDADDKYYPEKIEKQLLTFESKSSLHLVGTKVSYMDVKGNPLSFVDSKPIQHQEIIRKIPFENVFTGSTIMVRKDAWLLVGGYRDFFNSLGYEDYDFTSRFVEQFTSQNLDEPLYHYRQYPTSTSRYNMLYNPFKLNGHLLVQHFIRERKESGLDSLDRNDIPAIINFIIEKNKPYVDDPSLFHREVMWSYINKRMFSDAFPHLGMAFRMRPFSWKNLRTLGVVILIFFGIIKE